MSTHAYRVLKRRMCQELGLRTDTTTMAKLRQEWAARGYAEWPKDEQDMKRIVGRAR